MNYHRFADRIPNLISLTINDSSTKTDNQKLML